jgi:DNA-binding beta-propeller fold protein YncE
LKKLTRIIIVLAFLSAENINSQEVLDMNAITARDEFRVGVQAFNRFAYNEAILSFERALSFRPDEVLYHEWLGRAYYQSGLEGAALSQWQIAAENYDSTSTEALMLASRIETVRNRRSWLPLIGSTGRYVESGQYPGQENNITFFRQPTAVLPLEDGNTWIVAYGSNELVLMDQNGLIKARRRGPVNGFDRPYDLVRGLDGRMYLSEFRGGRVSILDKDGIWLGYIGSKGRGEGQFVGPQNLAVDDEGYIYVVDYGNQRIEKFDPDGTFIFSFGTKSPTFPGFLSPTGIAAQYGRIYVADNISNQIAIFDRNGTYRGLLVSSGLNGPESLKFLEDGRLLVVDTNRLLVVEPQSGIVTEVGLTGNDRVKVTNAAVGQNGNILVSNFVANEIGVMTGIDDMASGLFVQIDRIISDSFPLITVDISVYNRSRQPIIGLDHRNFFISEMGYDVTNQTFIGAGSIGTRASVSILVERSEKTTTLSNDIAVALRDINAHLNGMRIVSVVSAGHQPTKENISGDAQGIFSPSGIQALARGSTDSYSPRWRFDLGLRLAATDLLANEQKRAVIFISSGTLGELALEQYGISDLTAYLANNNIALYAVIVGGAPVQEDIRYLCTQTGGQVVSLYQNEGIGPAIQNIVNQTSGSYRFTYTSRLRTDFGRAYLPVEVQVYLMERSGRNVLGYFPPLE